MLAALAATLGLGTAAPMPRTVAVAGTRAAEEVRHLATTIDAAGGADPPAEMAAATTSAAAAAAAAARSRARQPLKHNFILTVNNNPQFTFFPPVIAAMYARRLGARPYVLMYDVDPEVAELVARYGTAATRSGVVRHYVVVHCVVGRPHSPSVGARIAARWKRSGASWPRCA